MTDSRPGSSTDNCDDGQAVIVWADAATHAYWGFCAATVEELTRLCMPSNSGLAELEVWGTGRARGEWS